MILLNNEWWRLFESPVVDLFFALTVLGLGWPLGLRLDEEKRGPLKSSRARGPGR